MVVVYYPSKDRKKKCSEKPLKSIQDWRVGFDALIKLVALQISLDRISFNLFPRFLNGGWRLTELCSVLKESPEN